MGVVYGVLPLPMVVGREAQHSGDEAPNFIRFPRSEKGIVGAVVKNNEDANPASRPPGWQEEPSANRKWRKSDTLFPTIGDSLLLNL